MKLKYSLTLTILGSPPERVGGLFFDVFAGYDKYLSCLAILSYPNLKVQPVRILTYPIIKLVTFWKHLTSKICYTLLIVNWRVVEMLANGYNLRGRIVQHDREQCLAYTNRCQMMRS